jgi:hypothetical protein
VRTAALAAVLQLAATLQECGLNTCHVVRRTLPRDWPRTARPCHAALLHGRSYPV